MNIKITPAILEAISKVMEAKSLTIPQLAEEINIGRVTLWRVYNGKQKSLTLDVYARLQDKFLIPYLHWADIKTEIAGENLTPEIIIENLQTEIAGLNLMISEMRHNYKEKNDECEKLEYKLNKLANIMSKN